MFCQPATVAWPGQLVLKALREARHFPLACMKRSRQQALLQRLHDFVSSMARKKQGRTTQKHKLFTPGSVFSWL
jgi:hypothetical protein